MESQSFIEKYKITDRIIWICLVFFFWYLIVGDGFIGMPIEAFFKSLKVSDAMRFVFMYTQTICGWIAFLILCLFKKNRGDVLHDVLPKKKPNSFSKLLKGLLIGFLMNFACILCALIHGDIKLYFDFSPAGIPLMLFALFSVFIQSSCEEIWTRGFMYERINVHYPLWVAILINGTVFGLLHSFNDGITPLAMADLIFCGIGFSLLKWYTGSIWTAFGVHTAWNFTQNLVFGLPNSGFVSETSIFHMDAVNAQSNLIYDYTFGVEGAIPATLLDLFLGLGCLYLGWKAGRIGELFESKEQKNAPPEVDLLTE